MQECRRLGLLPDHQPQAGATGRIATLVGRVLPKNLHSLEHGDLRRLSRFVEMAPQIRKLQFSGVEEGKPAKRKKRR